MEWDSLTDECLAAKGCSEQQVCAAAANKTCGEEVRRLRQEQRDIRRASKAVRKAYELNPNATKAEMREQAYKFVISSFLLSLIVQIVLSYAITWAIDWLLDRIFKKDEEAPDGVVSVPPERPGQA